MEYDEAQHLRGALDLTLQALAIKASDYDALRTAAIAHMGMPNCPIRRADLERKLKCK